MSKRKKTTAEFINEVNELVVDKYTVLGEYVTNKSKIRIKHNICETEWEITPLSFIQGRRCPKCAGVLKKTPGEFTDKVIKITSGEYEVLGSYTNNYTPTPFKHNLCGHEFKTQPKNFLSGSRCPKCAGNIKKDTSTFKNEIVELVGDEYELLGEYEGANIKILIKHKSCGTSYFVNPNNFLRGGRCPKCRQKN